MEVTGGLVEDAKCLGEIGVELEELVELFGELLGQVKLVKSAK